MSENTEQRSDPHRTMSQAMISEMLIKNFDKLTNFDQKTLMYGSLYLGANAGFTGLIANSMLRRVLNVGAARIVANLPMAVLPILVTPAVYNVLVSNRLVKGELDCLPCTLSQGALIGMFIGGLYPIVLALPLNLGLTARYESALLPEKSNLLRFSWTILQPVIKKMLPVLIFQAFIGSYLGYMQFQAYTNLVQITFSNSDDLNRM
ncbi:transmembrane protein 126A [Nematolebias whitei]|uniref:transmembrane protein 126A n=1 Tax=Nematolebias whitei TaxID=451745 RepID=UPI001898418A|nr:transmembrane protein 126A [Nematolebias whitei]